MTGGAVSNVDGKRPGEEAVKRRKVASAKQEPESSISGDEFFTISPYLVTLGSGVQITTVAAGGRHTLALSGNSTISWLSGNKTVFQDSCFVFVVTPYSFVGCRSTKLWKIFDVEQDT